MRFEWNDEQTALFKQLHARGLTYKQMLARPEFAGTTIRSLGMKSIRLKLPKQQSGRRPTPKPAPAPKAPRAPKPPRLVTAPVRPLPSPVNTAATNKLNGRNAMAAFDDKTVQAHHRRILDPGFGGCKWPISGRGAETFFCCRPRFIDPTGREFPYCEPHRLQAKGKPVALTTQRQPEPSRKVFR